MKIAIAGGSGFIGEAITEELLKHGHQVYILTRSTASATTKKNVEYIQWLGESDQPESRLEGMNAIINLAGESLSSGRWTPARKSRMLESRLHATDEIKRIIRSLNHKPAVLLNASAVGYYGTSTRQTFTEKNQVQPSDFLSQVVCQWEAEADGAGVRTVLMRFGVVLGRGEGALPRMALPYKLGFGGTLGSGRQIVSWIHVQDVVRAMLHCIGDSSLQGPVNFTSPKPITMKAFGQTIGKVLGKPHYFPAPAFAIKLLLGEMSVMALEGQAVLPEKLSNSGFEFHYSSLETALQDCLLP
ncbi:TIGR01777 family oxidoreductase [Paenibacillus sp. CAU 1782]